MRTITKTIYHFSELSEAAKEKARDWFRENYVLAWGDDSIASIRAFCDHFGAKLRDWNIGPYCPLDYRVDFDNSNFRGVKLRDFTGEEIPTGYCLDNDLWGTFHQVFKQTGDAKRAFEQAIYAGFKAWLDDMEWQLSYEYVDEVIDANGYEFYENGERA